MLSDFCQGQYAQQLVNAPVDPMTFGVVAVALLGVAGAASYLPARRVTRIDPTHALRADG